MSSPGMLSAISPSSCWIEAGPPAKAVQTFAGHSSLQVTMDRYGHLFPSDDHGRVMDAISEAFAATRPSPTPLRGPKAGTPEPS